MRGVVGDVGAGVVEEGEAEWAEVDTAVAGMAAVVVATVAELPAAARAECMAAVTVDRRRAMSVHHVHLLRWVALAARVDPAALEAPASPVALVESAALEVQDGLAASEVLVALEVLAALGGLEALVVSAASADQVASVGPAESAPAASASDRAELPHWQMELIFERQPRCPIKGIWFETISRTTIQD